jgi:hypothetical protein
MSLNLLFKTLNVLAPISDISSIITSYNCLYWHVSQFNECDDMFEKINKDFLIGMFNIKFIVKPSILKVISHVDTISKTLVFVKDNDISLMYDRNNYWIISFSVIVVLVTTPLVKKKGKCIRVKLFYMQKVIKYWSLFFI